MENLTHEEDTIIVTTCDDTSLLESRRILPLCIVLRDAGGQEKGRYELRLSGATDVYSLVPAKLSG